MGDFVGYEPKAHRRNEPWVHERDDDGKYDADSYIRKIPTYLIQVMPQWKSYSPSDRHIFRTSFVNMMVTTNATFLMNNEHIPVHPDEQSTQLNDRAKALSMPFTPAPIRGKPTTGVGPRVSLARMPHTVPIWRTPSPIPVIPRTHTPALALGPYARRSPLVAGLSTFVRRSPMVAGPTPEARHPRGAYEWYEHPIPLLVSQSEPPRVIQRQDPWGVPDVVALSEDDANLLVHHEIDQGGMMYNGSEVKSSAGSVRSHDSRPASLASSVAGSISSGDSTGSGGSGGSAGSNRSRLSAASLAQHDWNMEANVAMARAQREQNIHINAQ